MSGEFDKQNEMICKTTTWQTCGYCKYQSNINLRSKTLGLTLNLTDPRLPDYKCRNARKKNQDDIATPIKTTLNVKILVIKIFETFIGIKCP